MVNPPSGESELRPFRGTPPSEAMASFFASLLAGSFADQVHQEDVRALALEHEERAAARREANEQPL